MAGLIYRISRSQYLPCDFRLLKNVSDVIQNLRMQIDFPSHAGIDCLRRNVQSRRRAVHHRYRHHVIRGEITPREINAHSLRGETDIRACRKQSFFVNAPSEWVRVPD